MTRVRPGLQWSAGAAGPVLAALASDETSDWREHAACAETDPEAFFPEQGIPNAQAKTVCAGCFVREDCLRYALDNRIEYGVWGGQSAADRQRDLRRRLKRAAA